MVVGVWNRERVYLYWVVCLLVCGFVFRGRFY